MHGDSQAATDGASRCADGNLSGAKISSACALLHSACDLLAHALDWLELGARGCHKALRLALTIADMAGADGVRDEHVAKAISFGVLDQRLPQR
ncbi:MAG: hypothetical protein IPG43_23450 [Proteobacteria bacterium]|nr:hypothetical protein [Pseudomonadota bacterium]